MAEAVRAAAEPCDGFAPLVNDFDVIQPGGFALMAHLRAGGEAIAGQRRADEVDAAAGGHRRQPPAVAGVGEGGVRQLNSWPLWQVWWPLSICGPTVMLT